MSASTPLLKVPPQAHARWPPVGAIDPAQVINYDDDDNYDSHDDDDDDDETRGHRKPNSNEFKENQRERETLDEAYRTTSNNKLNL